MNTENNINETLKQDLEQKLEELKSLEKYFQKVASIENELKNEINKYKEKNFHLDANLQELQKAIEYYEAKCKDTYVSISDITWGTVKANIYLESEREIIQKYNLLFNNENKNIQTTYDSEKDIHVLITKENKLIKEVAILEKNISTTNNELSKLHYNHNR